MSESNGMGIVYPSIDIPGRGTVTVKFGSAAAFRLERDLGIDPTTFIAKLREWFPTMKKNAETGEDEVDQPGRTSPVFLFSVLSACTWKQLRMSPEDLAEAFEDFGELHSIAAVLMDALGKTRWTPRANLQETATPQLESAKPN